MASWADSKALVVVIDLAEQASGHKIMYKSETSVAVKAIKRLTKGHYDHVIIHHRFEATRANFLQSLEMLFSDPTVTTIDTIVYLHGKNGSYVNGPSVCFVGENPCVNVKDLAMQISLHPEAKNKLRFLYSDACWGRFHLDSWLLAGFKVASGSIGVDANQSVDLRRFLKHWMVGKTFSEAISFANRAPVTKLTDALIRKANSIKLTSGDGGIRF
jgi:hypothetical protein